MSSPREGEAATRNLRRINTFAISLLQQDTLEDVVWMLAETIGQLLNLEDCVIYLLEGDELRQVAAYGPKKAGHREVKDPLTLKLGEGITGLVAQTGASMVVKDTGEDALYVKDSFSGASEVTVPILTSGRVLGVIDSESSRPRRFR